LKKQKDGGIDEWFDLGEDFRLAHKYSEAIICFDKFLLNNPTNEIALFRKAQALNLADRKAEAIQTYDRILKMNPENAIALIQKSDILSDTGDYNGELECLNKFQNIHPQHRQLWAKKGRAFKKLNRLTEARYCFKRLLLLDPMNREAFSKIKEIEGEIRSKSINEPVTDKPTQYQNDARNLEEGSFLTDNNKGLTFGEKKNIV